MNAFLQRVQHLDTLTFLWLHVTKKIGFRRSARWLSRSGDGPLYVVFALLAIWADNPRGTVFFQVGCLAYALDVSLYLILKNTIKRDRPTIGIQSYRACITPSDKFSFPSGHTAAAFVFATLVAIFYPTFAPLCFVWAVAVGLSRVLLGVHYPTDILAGAFLGTVSALASVWLYSTGIGL